MNNKNTENYVADNIKELIHLRLKRLENEQICTKVLKDKANNNLDDLMIEQKAKGVSSAVKSSLGFLEQTNTNLNSWILSRYYALLQMTIAQQVSCVENYKILTEIQNSTSQGHGLNAIWINEEDISSFCVYLRSTGYFKTYLDYLNYDVNEHLLEISPNKIKTKIEENKEHLISIFDLFRRLPELSNYIKEYIGLRPLAFEVSIRLAKTIIIK